MSVSFSPIFNSQIVDENGAPAFRWKIYTYSAGSSSALATYTDSTGLSLQSNPIIINSLGFPTVGNIWLTDGSSYKLVLTDENDIVKGNPQDNIVGVGASGSSTASQFQISALSPTYISTTSFSLLGDQTGDFHAGRRVQAQVTAGTKYGTIASSVYNGTTLTTVTLTMDAGQTLDSGLSSVYLSLLRADHLAVPSPIVVLPGFRNLRGNANATTPTTKYDLSADAVTLCNSGNSSVTRFATGTLTCDLGLAGPAANGRDQAGAFSANSWVYIYFIWNGATVATLASTTTPASFSGSTLPTGYTHWAFAVSLRLNGASAITPVFCRGQVMHYQTTVSQSIIVSGATLVDISIYTPPISSEVILDFTNISGTTDGSGNLYLTAIVNIVSGVPYAYGGNHYIRGFTPSTISGVPGGVLSIPNISQSFYVSAGISIGTLPVFNIAVIAYKLANGAT